MKKLLGSLLILVAFAFTASAQSTPRYAAVTLAVPNVVTNFVTNTTSLGLTMYVGHQKDVTLQWYTLATNLTVRIGASVDNVNYDTNRFVVGVGNGTVVTNLQVNGIGYLRIDSVTQANGDLTATNTVKYGVKEVSP